MVTDNFQTPEDILERMGQNGSWIEGEVEMRAVAQLYNLRLVVLAGSRTLSMVVEPENPHDDTETIPLSNIDNFHFDLITGGTSQEELALRVLFFHSRSVL